VITFMSTDTGDAWRVRLVPHGWFWDRSDESGEVRVSASATELLLLLAGRPAPSSVVEGDRAPLDDWLQATTF
jgi:hypothetical protein